MRDEVNTARYQCDNKSTNSCKGPLYWLLFVCSVGWFWLFHPSSPSSLSISQNVRHRHKHQTKMPLVNDLMSHHQRKSVALIVPIFELLKEIRVVNLCTRPPSPFFV